MTEGHEMSEDGAEGTLYRAAPDDIDVVGRTLEGLAIPWDTWAVVRDLTGPSYPEAHARSNFDVSLRRDPGPRLLWSMHEYAFDPTADPLGMVSFLRSEHGLVFRAHVAKTAKGSEQLELVKSGAKRSVSVAFRPQKSRNVQRPEGLGKLRTESALLEMSLAPTGKGQYPTAKVLAMRAEQSPVNLEALRRDNLLRMRAGRPLLAEPTLDPSRDTSAVPPTEGHDENMEVNNDHTEGEEA